MLVFSCARLNFFGVIRWDAPSQNPCHRKVSWFCFVYFRTTWPYSTIWLLCRCASFRLWRQRCQHCQEKKWSKYQYLYTRKYVLRRQVDDSLSLTYTLETFMLPHKCQSCCLWAQLYEPWLLIARSSAWPKFGHQDLGFGTLEHFGKCGCCLHAAIDMISR